MWTLKTKIEDAELDVENAPILAIDRRGKFTVVGFVGYQSDEWVKCTLEKHNEFLTLFRKKIGIK